MRRFLAPFALLLLVPGITSAAQIIAGSAEDKMFQRITAETNVDTKLEELADFERQFPQSKGLPDAYMMAIELCRQKGDRSKIIDYGEKLLKLDPNNVNAMMVLSRNYAMQRKNVDRAVALGQQAVDRIAIMKAGPMPNQYNEAQWHDYLEGTEKSAHSILDYAKSVKVASPSAKQQRD